MCFISVVVAEIILSHVQCASRSRFRTLTRPTFDVSVCLCIYIGVVAVVTSSASPITFRLFIIRQSHLLHISCAIPYDIYMYVLVDNFFPLVRFFLSLSFRVWKREKNYTKTEEEE